MIDRWIARLSFKQQLAAFVVGVVFTGLAASGLVLFANYSPSQAALAFLVSVSVIFLACIVRIAFLVVKIIYQND